MKMNSSLERVRKRLNPELDITGIIACMYDSRTRLSHEVLDTIRQYFAAKVFNTIVRKNVKLAESPSHGVPIITYKPDAAGAADYMALAREVVTQEVEPCKQTDLSELGSRPIPKPDAKGSGMEPADEADDQSSK